jgi:hypothetical protein
MFSFWLTPHPLQFQSQAHTDALLTVANSALSENKKLEWQLDVLQEYDEKRMERFKRFLMSKRNNAF